MSAQTPQASLPQRTWIAKFTPETLDAYLSNPDPSSELRRSNTVWSDDFDNIIGPLPTSSDDQKSWSRRKVCHSKYTHDRMSLMAQGPQSSHLLFTDDCFLDGLVDGAGIMVIGVILLGAIAALLWLLGMRLRSCRSTRGRRRSLSAYLALPGAETKDLETEFEAGLCAEKV